MEPLFLLTFVAIQADFVTDVAQCDTDLLCMLLTIALLFINKHS